MTVMPGPLWIFFAITARKQHFVDQTQSFSGRSLWIVLPKFLCWKSGFHSKGNFCLNMLKFCPCLSEEIDALIGPNIQFSFISVPISMWEARPCHRTVFSALIHPHLRQMKPFSPHRTAFMAKSNPYRYYKNFLFSTFGIVCWSFYLLIILIDSWRYQELMAQLPSCERFSFSHIHFITCISNMDN